MTEKSFIRVLYETAKFPKTIKNNSNIIQTKKVVFPLIKNRERCLKIFYHLLKINYKNESMKFRKTMAEIKSKRDMKNNDKHV